MKDKIIQDLVSSFGKPVHQLMNWLLRYWDSHVVKQGELFSNNIQIGWSEENRSADDLMAYCKPKNEAAESQARQLYDDHRKLEAVKHLITCPEDAARALAEKTADGQIKCKFFTRIGHVREVICTCEGRPRPSRGYRVQLRGARNPLARPICDKCLGAFSRDNAHLVEVYNRIQDRRKPKPRPINPMYATKPKQERKPKPAKPSKPTSADLWKLTVVELRALCRKKDLPSSGTKGVLVDRLTGDSA